MKLRRILTVMLALVLALLPALALTGCEEIDSLITQLDRDLSEEENELPLPELRAHFIDVGQGDSTFIELPDGRTMLIDAGVTDAGDGIAKYIMDLGYDKIDFVVATHPHSDHIGGMRRVMNQLDVGNIYMPKVSAGTYTYEKLLKTIQNKGLRIKTAKAGVHIVNSTDPQFRVDIIAPIKSEYESLNDYSAVVKITFEDTAFLFMADAGELNESELLEKGTDVSADVIKVGHHGSSSSSSAEFIAAVSPEIGIISCGKNNDYGHPHKETLKRYKKAKTELYRTDKLGTIVVTSDGTDCFVEE